MCELDAQENVWIKQARSNTRCIKNIMRSYITCTVHQLLLRQLYWEWEGRRMEHP